MGACAAVWRARTGPPAPRRWPAITRCCSVWSSSAAASSTELGETGNGMSDATARHILVVDDDDRLRRLLQRYLTEHGYHVSTAADADEAKASLKNFAFDLMVLDVMLPGQNGISLTNELRAGRSADPAADRARRERRPTVWLPGPTTTW